MAQTFLSVTISHRQECLCHQFQVLSNITYLLGGEGFGGAMGSSWETACDPIAIFLEYNESVSLENLRRGILAYLYGFFAD